MKLYIVNRRDFDPVIVSALEERGIDLGATGYDFTFDDLASPLHAIAQSDAVAYRQRGPIRPQDAFELGIAAAQKRPMLVFADEVHAPLDLSLPQIQYATSLSSFLFAIEQLAIASHRNRRRRSKSRNLTTQQRRAARQFASYADWSTVTPEEYERRVVELIISTSPSSFAEKGDEGAAFDLAIWDSSLEHSVGTPVVIEAKITATPHILDEVRLQSRRLGPTYSKALVVLLYLDGIVPRRGPEERLPRVVAINSVALAQDLMNVSLADALERAVRRQSA